MTFVRTGTATTSTSTSTATVNVSTNTSNIVNTTTTVASTTPSVANATKTESTTVINNNNNNNKMIEIKRLNELVLEGNGIPINSRLKLSLKKALQNVLGTTIITATSLLNATSTSTSTANNPILCEAIQIQSSQVLVNNTSF